VKLSAESKSRSKKHKAAENADTIITWIKSVGGEAIKNHPVYGRAHDPDILAVVMGWPVALEVKKEGEEAREGQSSKLRKWAQAGAITGVVVTKRDVITLLNERGVMLRLQDE